MTAVEWLYENILINPMYNEDVIYNEDVLEMAKEMEKQQIINAYRNGRSDQQSKREGRFYNRLSE